MFTYGVNFLGSTETANSTDERIWNYARQSHKAEWPVKPVTYVLWTDESLRKNCLDKEPNLTIEEMRVRMESRGMKLFATEQEAVASAEAMVKRCEQAIREVYGTMDAELLELFSA